MVERPRLRRLLALVLAALFAAAGRPPRAEAAPPDRPARAEAVDSRALRIDADEIVTWVEGETRVILLRGQVMVEYGALRTRFREGVALIDLRRYKSSRIWDVELLAEGDVTIQDGTEARTVPSATLEMHTRGELKLNAHKSKVAQERRADDPLYQRVMASRRSAPEAATVTPASFETPARPTQATPPPPPPPPIPSTAPSAPPPPPPPPVAALPPPPAPSPAPAAPRAGGLLGGAVPGGPAPVREYVIVPRSPGGIPVRIVPDERTGEKALVASGGFLINVRSVDAQGRAYDLLDVEADQLVLWTTGDPQQLVNNIRSAQGTQTNTELELYLRGNVEIRSRGVRQDQTLRAEEVYYDVSRNVAVAVGADLELRQPGIAEPIHLRASEVEQLAPGKFRALQGEVFASRLPSDPGLKVAFTRATLEETRQPRRSVLRNLLGAAETGATTVPESLVRAEDVFLRVEDYPILYLPFLKGDARDPLGPVESIMLGGSRVFGFQAGVGLDVYDLFGLDRIAGTRWRLDVDYLSRRGPVLGTNFDFAGKDLFGVPSVYSGQVRLWGLRDEGTDILGGGRGEFEPHPAWRGRADARVNVLDLPYGFSFQGQIVGLSDKNFLEQYFKREFDEDPNKESYLYVKQQQDNWAWTLLTEGRLRNWVTETEWLPRADGYLIGQSLLGLLSYNAHASAGYARLLPTDIPPPPFSSTDVRADTGRFDLMQELSLPVPVGPVKVVPYALLDLTYYTRDLTGEDNGRAYGGGGVRASMPFSRLYPDVQSLLFNVHGINHKIVLSGNYYYSESTDRYTLFPQLDRLNDDATDQSQRDIRPIQPAINPSSGYFLATSPLYDPQRYAIRRLVDSRIDTLDHLEVVQLDVRQRWQTKRGFPGRQHIVDWMTLDLSTSIFPRKDRDNFGEPLAFLEYDWNWNVGDRTALYSSGWVDPIDHGPRVFTVGASLNRTDRTTFALGYRAIEPINSHAVTGSVVYVFSPKYAMTAHSLYDFGTNQSLANALVLTRMGSDLQVSLGITYNALQQSFGMTLEVLPNLVSPGRRIPGIGIGPGLLSR